MSTHMILSISSTSFCLMRLVIVVKCCPVRFANIQRAFAVLPLEDSMISLWLLSLSILRAVLSFSDQNGFKYSSFAYISTPGILCTDSGIRRSGVFQICSVIDLRIIFVQVDRQI